MALSDSKKESVKVVGIIGAGTVVSKIVSIPAGIITANILGPANFGVLAVIYLIENYLSYCHFGLLSNLARELPIAYGKGDKKEVRLISNVVFTFYLLLTILGLAVLWAIFILGFKFIIGGVLDISLMVLITVLIIIEHLNSFFHGYIKGKGRFTIFAKLDLITKFANPILTVCAVYFFGVNGIVFVLVLIHFIGVAYSYISLDKPEFSFVFDFAKAIELLKTGSVIFFNKIVEGFYQSIGTTLLVIFSTSTNVGLYSFALGLSGSDSKNPLSASLGAQIGRKMMFEGGREGMEDYSKFDKYTKNALSIFILSNCLILGLIILFYFANIGLFLVDFKESIILMLIFYFGYVFYNARVLLYNFLILTKQFNKQLIILLCGVVLNGAIGYGAIKLGYGTTGIAIGCAVSFIMISAGVIQISFRQIRKKRNDSSIFLFKLLVISSLLTSVLYMMNHWYVLEYLSVSISYKKYLFCCIDLFIKSVLFSFVCVSAFVVMFRGDLLHLELIGILKHIFFLFREKIMSRNNTSGSSLKP